MKSLIALIVTLALVLFFVSTNTVNTVPVTDEAKVALLQEQGGGNIGIQVTPGGKEEDKEEEKEEEEEEELDYELGKVDPATKKASRYVCEGCGEVQLNPFKCEICEKDAKKEELDVEERNGKWYIKGTNTQVVEKEPEEEEEETAEEGGKEAGKKGGD